MALISNQTVSGLFYRDSAVALRYLKWYQAPVTRVCKLEAMGGMSYLDVADDPWAFHEVLGGYMETIGLAGLPLPPGLIGLVDEEGLLKHLPYNAYSPLLGQTLLGPVLIARAEPPEFVDLTEHDVIALGEWFGRQMVVAI